MSTLARPLVCPELVGRAGPLGALRSVVDGSDRDARVVVVSGDAGIGKSRLLRAAREIAEEQGFSTRQAACYPEDVASPYALIRDLAPDQPLATTPQPVDQRQLVSALAHGVVDRNESGPTLLVVEDLQWCDPGSLDVLLEIVRRAAERRIVLLVSARPQLSHAQRSRASQLVRSGAGFELSLGPLSDADVRLMLETTLGRAAPAELERAVQRLADGNPLYVEELLKALAMSGELVLQEDGWQWQARTAATWRLPPSVQHLVSDQVASLSEPARSVLTLASVVGRRFDLRLLQALSGMSEPELLNAMKELVGAQLVVEELHDVFVFRHALTREAVYTSLLGRERAALHRRVGEAAETLYADRLEQRVDDLALHFYQAEAWDKVLAYSTQAGERAEALAVPDAAVTHYTHALEAAEHLLRQSDALSASAVERTLSAILARRGTSLEILGRVDEARADYEAALAQARAVRDAVLEWHALIDLGQLWAASDYSRTGDLFRDALQLARRLDEPRLIASSLNRIGNWQVNAEHPRQALGLHREALAIFERLADRRGIAETLDLLGTAAYLAADHAEATSISSRAVALFSELDDKHGLIMSLSMLALRGGSFELGSATADAATVREGLRQGQQAIDHARAAGWRAGEAFALMNRASVLLLQGDYAAALDHAKRAEYIADDIGHRQWLAFAHCLLGWIYLDVFAIDRARSHLEQASRLAHDIRSAFWIQVATGGLGFAHAVDGQLERAAEVLGPLPESLAPVESLGERFMNYGHIYLALARGDAQLALTLADRASPPGLDGKVTAETPRPALARAEALIALGRTDAAEEALARAAAIAQRQEARPLLWRCLTLRAKSLLSRGEAAQASHDLGAARAVVEELAASLEPELAEALLTRTSVPIAPTARQAGPLSARELEVAHLVAAGLTNREIADRLIISKWTADNHVANILRKLNLARRAQISGWLSSA